MKAVRVAWLVPLVVGLLALASPAAAQAPGDVLLSFTKSAVFRIPFQMDPGPPRLKEVQLYVSTDQGRSWQPYANVPPDRGFFTFSTEHDGLYWFAVRTVDLENRPYPLTMDGARPGLKVVVDTRAPIVDLHLLQPRDGMVGVGWDIRDDNLDLGSLHLEYRLADGAEWRPLNFEPAASGQHYWRPDTNVNLEVRLRVRDRADNWSEKTVAVGGGVDNRYTEPNRAEAAPAALPAVHMINSKHISLNYDVRDKGPSGISVVELWYTQDGRNWQKYGEKPYAPPYIVDVNDEGLYGFTLVVKSGVGLGDRPPQVGDPPQVWIEVDLTKPVVRLQGVDVGRGPDAGKLTILYAARDKHLKRQPITLSYATEAAGPWKPIAEHVENTGRYVWQMPSGIPYQFLVRVEATDRAGNVGSDETAKPVIVDLSQPKSVILDVGPAPSP